MTISKGRKESIVGKHWTKAKQKPSRANDKVCISVSDIKRFLQINSLQLCWQRHTFLSWAGSTPCQQLSLQDRMTLVSPTQSRPHLHSCILLLASTQGQPWHMTSINGLPYSWREILQSLSCILDSKTRTWLQHHFSWYSSSNVTFCLSLSPQLAPFQNHMTASILACLEISSASAINLKILNLAPEDF